MHSPTRQPRRPACSCPRRRARTRAGPPHLEVGRCASEIGVRRPGRLLQLLRVALARRRRLVALRERARAHLRAAPRALIPSLLPTWRRSLGRTRSQSARPWHWRPRTRARKHRRRGRATQARPPRPRPAARLRALTLTLARASRGGAPRLGQRRQEGDDLAAGAGLQHLARRGPGPQPGARHIRRPQHTSRRLRPCTRRPKREASSSIVSHIVLSQHR